MKAKRITALEFALLGLVSQKPRSGYELIQVFRDRPMAHFSDSPGAIYPALRRMESAGLQVETRLAIEGMGAVRTGAHWKPTIPSCYGNGGKGRTRCRSKESC